MIRQHFRPPLEKLHPLIRVILRPEWVNWVTTSNSKTTTKTLVVRYICNPDFTCNNIPDDLRQ